MTETETEQADRLRAALSSPTSSTRLQAALTAGSSPHADYIEALIDRCAVEPDFYVRDMLTWALVRNDAPKVVDRLLIELGSEIPQARAQALHTLSKIGRRETYAAIPAALLSDDDDEVAGLAEALSSQFGRGDREVQLSLSRAFVRLGTPATPVVERAAGAADAGVRAHATATLRLIDHPDEGFDAAIAEARRVVAVRDAPKLGE